MAQLVLDRLQQHFGDAIVETHSQHGNETAVVAAESLYDVAQFLRDDPEMQFDMPTDCTAVDWMDRYSWGRFEVVYHLYSTTQKHRVRLKVRVPEADPSCPSLTPLWEGMNWHEREAWDMYGIRFQGHPKLKRILMYEEFKGHPLRKDYPIDGRQPLIEMRPVKEVATQRDAPADMLNKP